MMKNDEKHYHSKTFAKKQVEQVWGKKLTFVQCF
jgi:hypothetical protein